MIQACIVKLSWNAFVMHDLLKWILVCKIKKFIVMHFVLHDSNPHILQGIWSHVQKVYAWVYQPPTYQHLLPSRFNSLSYHLHKKWIHMHARASRCLGWSSNGWNVQLANCASEWKCTRQGGAMCIHSTIPSKVQGPLSNRGVQSNHTY